MRYDLVVIAAVQELVIVVVAIGGDSIRGVGGARALATLGRSTGR